MAKKATRQVSIFLNGKELSNTIRGITSEQKRLNNELNNTIIGTEEYELKAKELEKINGIIQAHRKGISGIKNGYDLLKAGLDNFIGVAAGAFAVDALIGYGKALFGTGVAMDALAKKAKTVFAEALPFVTREAEKNAKAMGLTTTQYINAAASIQDLLIPMGFQRKEAAEISTNLINLSGALSEWTGGQVSATQVSEILSSALLGEREQLKQLGVSLQQADIDARLAEQGLSKLTGTARQQAEAAATLALITEKTTDAQAAFANGAGSAVRSQAELAAKIAEIGEKLAVIFLPILSRIAEVVGGVVGVFSDLVDGVDSLANPTKAATKAFDDQASKVADLESNVAPLVKRYDELTAKTTLTKEEQDELQKIVKTVAGVVPSAVTEFGKYGEALSLNTDKAREFIEVEKQRLKFVNQEAIAATEQQIKLLEQQAAAERNQLANKVKFEGGSPVPIKLSDAEIQQAQEALNVFQTKLDGAQAEVKRLKGETLDAIKTVAETPPPTPPTPPIDPDKARKAAESLKKDLLALIADVTKISEDQLLQSQNSELDIAITGVERRYDAEIKKAIELEKRGADEAVAQRIALEALKQNEIGRISEEYYAKEIERVRAQERTKAQAQYEEIIASEQFLAQREQERKAAEAEIKAATDAALLTDNEKLVLALEDRYKKLLELAKEFGFNTTEITRAYEAEKVKITKDSNKQIFEQQRELEQAQFDLQVARLDALGAGVSAFASIFEEGSAIGKAAFLFEKALSAAMVIINFQKERALIWSNVRAIPDPTGITQTTIATLQVSKARTRMIESLATIGATAIKDIVRPKTTQKFSGSYLDVTGETDGRSYRAKNIGAPSTGLLPGFPVLMNSRATGAPVLASERGAEYFVASHDLRNPYVANLVRMIDLATHGRGVAQYADGGLNAATSAPTPPAPMMDMSVFTNLNNTLANLTRLLAGGLYAVLPDQTIVDAQQRLAKINEVSGGYYS